MYWWVLGWGWGVGDGVLGVRHTVGAVWGVAAQGSVIVNSGHLPPWCYDSCCGCCCGAAVIAAAACIYGAELVQSTWLHVSKEPCRNVARNLHSTVPTQGWRSGAKGDVSGPDLGVSVRVCILGNQLKSKLMCESSSPTWYWWLLCWCWCC